MEKENNTSGVNLKSLWHKPFFKIAAIIVILLLCVIFLVVAYALLNTGSSILNTSQNSSQSRVVDTTVKNDNPTCTLPVVNFDASAFSIGVPNGWIYEVDNGTVSIMQDSSNTTAAFLYTAKLEQDLSPKDFLDKFSTIFNKTITDVKGTFNIENIISDDTTASGDISATIGSDSMKGVMKVEKSEGFVILKSYWAPVADYSKKETTLTQIVDCFGRTKILTPEVLKAAETKSSTGVTSEKTATGFEVYNGKYFKLSKPSNFTVNAETDSGIDLTRSDGNAGFSYAYVTGMNGSYTPKSWAEKALPEFAKIQNLSLGSAKNITSPIDGQDIQEFDFTGLLNGYIDVKGKVTVGIYNTPYVGIGPHYSSAFWGIEVATPSEWDGAKSTLQIMQDSVQITNIGATRSNTLLPPNRPLESSGTSITSDTSYADSVSDESSQYWEDAMLGFETVESPSTGDKYDVPLNSWSSTGPDGAGYYRQLPDDSLEKLQ